MLRRLFAFTVLLLLVGGGYYLWVSSPHGRIDDLQGLGGRFEDLRVTASVRAALALNRRLQTSDLHVDTAKGRIRLTGSAPDAATRSLAMEVAMAVPGVSQVDSSVAVNVPPASPEGDGRTLGERLDDQALAGKLKLAFSLHRDLAGLPVQIEVRRRRVTLAGLPTASTALALRVARDVPDVLEVELQ